MSFFQSSRPIDRVLQFRNLNRDALPSSAESTQCFESFPTGLRPNTPSGIWVSFIRWTSPEHCNFRNCIHLDTSGSSNIRPLIWLLLFSSGTSPRRYWSGLRNFVLGFTFHIHSIVQILLPFCILGAFLSCACNWLLKSAELSRRFCLPAEFDILFHQLHFHLSLSFSLAS